jgi:hypothetical protein
MEEAGASVTPNFFAMSATSSSRPGAPSAAAICKSCACVCNYACQAHISIDFPEISMTPYVFVMKDK